MVAQASQQPNEPRRRRRWLVTLGLCLLWSLVTLYPNPTLLPRAIANAYDPKVDAEAVRPIAAQLPDDPAYIEQWVEREYLPYAVPWETHGVPWYYPTTREVIELGVADCQGRMLVFASILEAKGIPYQLRASFDHIWVEYEHKQETTNENAAIAIMDDGALTVPASWDWRRSYEVEKDYFWDRAPVGRRVLFLGGLTVIMLRRRIARVARRAYTRATAGQPSLVEQLAGRVGVWEAEGRLAPAEARQLRAELDAPELVAVAPHLGVHVGLALLVPFPFAGIGRAGWTLWMLLRATGDLLRRRIDRAAWQRAWRMHHPLVALVGALPVIGSAAYLLGTPLRRNHLLLRLVLDTTLAHTPWRLYERSGSRRLVTLGRPAASRPAEAAGD